MSAFGVKRTSFKEKRTSAGRSATCGSARCHPLTSPFRALLYPQSLYIHPSAHFADVHGGMLFESRCDAIFDVLPDIIRGKADINKCPLMTQSGH